ncbi:hypothetical protein [Pseudomonas sp. HY7a-MNA-CIBAN-0227]|uniref:hypothetical protein n=1 Tax=Pseudomonas sp. HY7a-MNA-CIBAN-0227 TaxID=3140474 RepID=UPI00331E8B6A
MNIDRTKPHKYFYGGKIVHQALNNRLDEICWQTLKTYPYIQDLNVNSVYDYVEERGLFLYDFGKMIDAYESEHGTLPYKVVKDKKALGPVSNFSVYRIEDLDTVWNYFNDGRTPIYLEFVSLKDFVNAVKGNESFIKVRTRWYKRLELVGVKKEQDVRKRKNKLADVTLTRISDQLNSNKKTKAFFYSLSDLLVIAEIYKKADERKQAIN